MPHIYYQYLSAKGKKETRFGAFDSPSALHHELTRSGDSLLYYFPLSAGLSNYLEKHTGKPLPIEIIELCENLALYIANGVDLHSSILDMERSVRRAAFKHYLSRLRYKLTSGFMLSQALTFAGGAPQSVVTMTSIGEATGKLENTLRDAAEFLKYKLRIASSIKRALTYPTFIITMLLLGMTFWILYVVPQIVELFTSLNIALPAGLRYLLASTEFVKEYISWSLVLPLCASGIYFGYKNSPRIRWYVDKLIWSAPLISLFVQYSQKALFFRYLALLYNSGQTITNSLTIVRDASSNEYFRTKITELNSLLRQGSLLGAGVEQLKVFEPITERMITIGEQTGSLSSQLEKIAAMYSLKLDDIVQSLSKLIEPLLMILVAILFAAFAFTLIGPLYDLLGGLGSA